MVTLVVVMGATLVGCASSEDATNEIEGIVTEVTGDLTNVQSFVVLDSEGDSHLFTPAPGLLFHGGPLSHLREHIVTGERVVVTFTDSDSGARTAILVVHADGGTAPDSDADHDHDDGSHDHDHGDTSTTTGG